MKKFFKICIHIAYLILILNGMKWIGITENTLWGIPQMIIGLPYTIYIIGLITGNDEYWFRRTEDKDKDEV